MDCQWCSVELSAHLIVRQNLDVSASRQLELMQHSGSVEHRDFGYNKLSVITNFTVLPFSSVTSHLCDDLFAIATLFP